MKFIKMQGCGNDFIVVDAFQETVAEPGRAATKLCKRHFGIGADGLILVEPAKSGHGRMRMFNPDGGEAEMCGNGIRCVAHFLYTRKDQTADRLLIETGSGVREVVRQYRAGYGETYEVEMGSPLFLMPGPSGMVEAESGPAEISVAACKVSGTPLSMGNPHFVVFVENLEQCPVAEWGMQIEGTGLFKRGTNVEFVQILKETRLAQRTWERGAKETLACGTGAAASAAVAIAYGWAKSPVEVRLPGGSLFLRWDSRGPVYLSGDAVEVFHGEVEV
ncbi:MAG: diaminopimelate epimerase [Planctomycetes bacterium]|nr:diaminopimelate epimerase [Planctomycetota bacterium]